MLCEKKVVVCIRNWSANTKK